MKDLNDTQGIILDLRKQSYESLTRVNSAIEKGTEFDYMAENAAYKLRDQILKNMLLEIHIKQADSRERDLDYQAKRLK